MKSISLPLLLFLALLITPGVSNAQSTSWKGTTSMAWSNSANWTNGVPGSILNAIIGDANFTGSSQPTISNAEPTITLGVDEALNFRGAAQNISCTC